MPRFKNDALVKQAFAQYLQGGERLVRHAYGVKQPPLGVLMLLLFMAVVPGLLAIALFTEEYVVGLTDRGRLLALRFSGKLRVKQILEFRLNALEEVHTEVGPLTTRIVLRQGTRRLCADFHRRGLVDNRAHSQAIAAALEAQRLPVHVISGVSPVECCL